MATYEKKRAVKSGMTRMNSGKNVAQAKVATPRSASTNSGRSTTNSGSGTLKSKRIQKLPHSGGTASASKLPGTGVAQRAVKAATRGKSMDNPNIARNGVHYKATQISKPVSKPAVQKPKSKKKVY